jgi:ABC-type glycerol-3-phosphate transport system permease component
LIYALILFSSVVTGTATMVPIFRIMLYLKLIDTHYAEAGTPATLTSSCALLFAFPVLALYLLVNWRYGFCFFGGIKR